MRPFYSQLNHFLRQPISQKIIQIVPFVDGAAKELADDKRTGFFVLLGLGVGVSLLVFFIIFMVLKAIRARNLKRQQLNNDDDEEVVLVDTSKKKKSKVNDSSVFSVLTI